MLKLILLGQWNSMSDEQLEEALRVRLDFISFCDFDISDEVPDHSTICRFRNKLVEKELMEKILGEINHQLESLNLKVKKSNLAIVDATIIESNSRSKAKIIEEVPVDRKEEESSLLSISDSSDSSLSSNNPNNPEYKEQISYDPDATWLKKGSKSYFGYKSFATTDEEGFINNTHTTPANESETKQFEVIAKNINAKRASADKAYDSKANRGLLRKNNIKTGLMYKAKRGKPLTRWQKIFNNAISKKRFRVEQTFGTLKRRFKFRKASYITTEKVHAQFTMKAICLNLLKAVNKVELIPPPRLQMG